MTTNNSLLLYRILSGRLRFRTGEDPGRLYMLGPVLPWQRAVACEIHEEALLEASSDELFGEEDLYAHLLESQEWTEEEENLLLTKVPKDIEDFKVGLYEHFFKSDVRKETRRVLSLAKEKYADLYGRRHSKDHLSCQGFAAQSQSRYLVACMLRDARDRPLFKDYALRDLRGFWSYAGTLLDQAVDFWASSRAPDGAIRAIALSCPHWREIWNSRRGCPGNAVFSCLPSELTDEQRALLNWALTYEDVQQHHPECPPQEILEDDDCFDGWLILQKRKKGQKLAEDLISGGNEKIRNAEEVFVVVDSKEDAKKVNSLNDGRAQKIVRQRLEQVHKAEQEGKEISEYDLSDVKQRIRMEAARAIQARMKGKG